MKVSLLCTAYYLPIGVQATFSNPSLHMHAKPPSKLTQVAPSGHGLDVHSSENNQIKLTSDDMMVSSESPLLYEYN